YPPTTPPTSADSTAVIMATTASLGRAGSGGAGGRGIGGGRVRSYKSGCPPRSAPSDIARPPRRPGSRCQVLDAAAVAGLYAPGPDTIGMISGTGSAARGQRSGFSQETRRCSPCAIRCQKPGGRGAPGIVDTTWPTVARGASATIV